MNTIANSSLYPRVNAPEPARELSLSIDDFYGIGIARRSDYEAMKSALQACREQRASRLVLPKRTYRFDDPRISDEEAHILLHDLADFVIDGQGSELLFHHIKLGFRIRRCQRLVLRDIVVDWDFPLASPGVMERQPDGKMAVRISDDFPLGDKLLATSVTHFDTANGKWIMKIAAEAYYPKDVVKLGPQLIYSKIFDAVPSYPNGSGRFQDAMPVCVRHYVYQAGFADFGGTGNEDLAFEDITVYQCPGHAFSGYGCERGFRLSRIRIERRPGYNRLVSATADGSHFGATRGDIIIEDCDFSGMGDDSVNIHGTWLEIVSSPGPRILSLTSRWFDWSIRMDPGDELKLCRKENLADYATVKIITCQLDMENKVGIVTLDADLPPEVRIGDFVANVTRSSAKFMIRNNYFHDHRARGMLLQARSGLVENNRIRNVMGAALQMTSDCHFWKEGYGCENVIVRDNFIEGCNHVAWERGALGRHMGCISLIVETCNGLGDAPVHSGITFERNTIKDTAGLAILISSARDVVLRDNLIINSNLEPFEQTGEAIDAKADGSIMVTRAQDVTIVATRFEHTLPTFADGIYVDPRNTANVYRIRHC